MGLHVWIQLEARLTCSRLLRRQCRCRGLLFGCIYHCQLIVRTTHFWADRWRMTVSSGTVESPRFAYLLITLDVESSLGGSSPARLTTWPPSERFLILWHLHLPARIGSIQNRRSPESREIKSMAYPSSSIGCRKAIRSHPSPLELPDEPFPCGDR